MCVSLSVRILSCFTSSIRRFFLQNRILCDLFRIGGLPTSNIWYQSLDVLHPAAGHHSNSWITIFCFFLFWILKKQRKEEEGKTWFASHRVRSHSFGVSQRLYSAICDRNHSGWNLFVQHSATFATVIRSCSIRLDGIRTGFRTLLTARCNHSVQIDLWTTTPIHASLGWSTFGRIS